MGWDEHRNDYIHKQEEADGWQGFHSRFMQLAGEEQGQVVVITKEATLRRMDRVLRAYCDYSEHPQVWEKGKPEQGIFWLLKAPENGLWTYSDGVSENFLERVRVLVAQAGVALGCPKCVDPEDFWLHRLYLNLCEAKSKLLLCESGRNPIEILGESKNSQRTNTIISVCVASATFCARLGRQALGKNESGNLPEQQQDTGGDLLRTSATQAEGSPVENNEKTTGGFSHSQDYCSVSIHGKNFALTSRQAQVIQILDERRKEGHPDVGQDYILEQLGSPNSRLSDTFKSSRDAWKALVVNGKKKGIKRLSL